jgi:eukaryotic-like serine/threonine-protein kinase
MTPAAGSKLGPYEVLSPIGAGGMGEVYRAKDPRLGRDVAIKVLPSSFSADTDRLRRFEQEARAAGILNHPNITAVYDIGSHDGAPYVVQELLEGETLRSVLAGGRLSTRRAIDYSLQIAHGLAAAHEKGIVHRDLKPENIFVTRDGRVKILDFGLAKLTHQEEGAPATSLPTATAGTEPGVVLGTLGYMSPEQVRGRPADARSDIFSFGAIFYEMLSGRRAFHGDSAADTMSAILKEDPPDLSITNQSISPGLERIVRHCLEKNPEQRFQSARDLAFDLEALSGTSGQMVATPAARRSAGRRLGTPAIAAGALALLLAAFWVGRKSTSSAAQGPNEGQVLHRRLTFRRGNVLFARFTADAQQVVYGASWGDRPTEVFLTRIGSPETRPLGIPGASLLSVSPSGELAILLKKGNLFGVVGTGTLARVPLAGGTPRQILEDVVAADWTPDGKNLAVVRQLEGKSVLDFPIGKRLYASTILANPRVSPDGGKAAVIESDQTSSWIDVIDGSGNRKELAKGFIVVDSIAWHPSGKEIWFMAVSPKTRVGMYAVDLSGKVRLVGPTSDMEVLHDIAANGDVLVEREISTREVHVGLADGGQERDLSWLESSTDPVLSSDGKTMIFWESQEGGGPAGSVYLRTTDGAPAVRLGDGRAQDISPDGKWVLALAPSAAGPRLTLLPTGAGEPKEIPVEHMQVLGGIFVPPDGKRLLIGASEPGQGVKAYVLDLAGGKPRGITPDLTAAGAISSDGKLFATNGADKRPVIFRLDGGSPKPIPSLEPDDTPIQWGADGDTLYVTHYGETPLKIYRVHLSTGKKELWKEIMPADRTGFIRIESVSVARDGKSYAYAYEMVTASDLFLVTGWK